MKHYNYLKLLAYLKKEKQLDLTAKIQNFDFK